jgi:D-glycero-alpha-D-manno-heptose-7-phosphate kinase
MLVRSRAPLRLSIAGGGTDVAPYSDLYGGAVLNATIDMYAYCVVEPSEEGIVFHAADRNETYFSPMTDALVFDGNMDLHKGVYNRIVREHNHGQPLGLKLTTYSDAPIGSGLGSSSTIVVAMIKAFVEWLNLPLGEYEVAHLAHEVERFDVGLKGGKQDQYAATFGGFNFIEFHANDRVIVNPLRIKHWIICELESSMVLYYSGVSRESARIIDEQSNRITAREFGSLEATHEIKRLASQQKEALLRGDIHTLAHGLNLSWEAKKQLAPGIINPALQQIYDTARAAGASAGKISGAGGGGFLMFIVDPIKREPVIKALAQFPGKVFRCHFTKNGTEGWKIFGRSPAGY